MHLTADSGPNAVEVLAVIGILLFSSLGWFWIYRSLAKPVQFLEQGMLALSRKGEIRKLAVDGKDHLGRLLEAYNLMLDKLEESREEISKEARRLEVINRLVSLSDFNFEPDKINKEALRVVLQAMDLDYVAIYGPEPQTGKLGLKYGLLKEGVVLPELEALPDWQEIIEKTAQTNRIFVAEEKKREPKAETEPDLLSQIKPAIVAIPIVNKEAVARVVAGVSFRRAFFHPDELQVFSSLCQHLGVVLENLRLYHDLREKVIEITTFNQIGQALSSILDVDQLLKQLLQIVTTSFGYNVCVVFLHDEEKGELASVALWGYPPEIEQAGLRLKIPGPGLCNWVVQKGEPVLINNVTEDPRYWPGWPDCRSELAVPLKSQDKVIGVLNVESDKTNAFTEKDLHILTTLASQISILLQNARYFQEEKENSQQLLVADQINQAIASTLDLNRIFEIVSQGLKQFIEQDGIFFYFYNSAERCFQRAYYSGNFRSSACDQLDKIPLANTNMWNVVQSKDVFVCNHLEEGKYGRAVQEHLYRIGIRSYILVPVQNQNEVVGCFNLVSRHPFRFGKREIQIARSVANHLAVAIKNSHMYQELASAYEDLKSAQETLIQSEKLRTLGEMTSGIVHDFNNLLATILGRTQILLQKFGQPEQLDLDTCLKNLKAMEKAALDGSQLLSRISQFGKAKAMANLTAVQINEVVTDSIELARPRWKDQSLHQGIKITINTRLEAASPILADAAELREVLMNLIINAVDAMPQGGEISIQTGQSEDNVWLKVSDTGFGMARETRKKIFDPFFTTKGKKGTGLGLTICLSIVKRLKGEINVESEPGQGACFTLSFPRPTESEFPGAAVLKKAEAELSIQGM